MATIEGTRGGCAFSATLEPDGDGSHWLKVRRTLREAAGAGVGATVALEMAVVAKEPEPEVPAELDKALAKRPAAKATSFDITPVARRDWIHWISSGKQAATRERRIRTACDLQEESIHAQLAGTYCHERLVFLCEAAHSRGKRLIRLCYRIPT